MACLEKIEVYIPKGASVKNIPFQSLPTSTARKIRVHLCESRSGASETQMVTWISPVELRDKAETDSSEVAPLGRSSSITSVTPGQFWLPVVSSSIKAYKVLRKILTTHKPPIQLSGPETEAASLPNTRASFLQKNCFIVFNNQIFLSVKKSRGRQVSSQHSALASPSACPALPSQQHQQNASPSCQTQSLPDTSHRQQQRTDAQPQIRGFDNKTQTPKLLQKVSEDLPEQCCTSRECLKGAGSTSDSPNCPPKPPEDLEPNQGTNIVHQSKSTTHMFSEASGEPEAAGGEEAMHEHLETAGFLPRVESCHAFDFQLLAKEEKINHLRARLRQKEAALSILKSKPTDQV